MEAGKMILPTREYLDAVCGLLRDGKEVSVPVAGSSMAPFLVDKRDSVLLRAASAPPKKGDILLYRRADGRYVLHRVCKVKGDTLTMIGDAQLEREPGVTRAQVCGKAESVVRRGKRVAPGDFWWEFFSRVWIRMIPLRPAALRVYGWFSRLRRGKR